MIHKDDLYQFMLFIWTQFFQTHDIMGWDFMFQGIASKACETQHGVRKGCHMPLLLTLRCCTKWLLLYCPWEPHVLPQKKKPPSNHIMPSSKNWRRMMFRGGFEARRKSLRLEQGRKISCPKVLLIFKLIIFNRLGNNSNQTKLAFKLIVRDMYHLVNELWPPF